MGRQKQASLALIRTDSAEDTASPPSDSAESRALVSRVDFARFDGSKIERTPQGGLKVPASLTRTGVFSYRNADGTVRKEYRPADEVFNKDSLASLEDAPVTDLHPAVAGGLVTAENHGQLSRGHVRDVDADGKFVKSSVLVQDAALVKAVESGERKEISCGYRCTFDPTPGVSPDGERYDGVQRNIVYNHVALLPRGMGRAGSEVALRLDSYDAVQVRTDSDEKVITVTKIVLDGKEYVVGSAEHLAKIDEMHAAKLAEVTKRADSLEAERDQLKKDLAEAPAKIAAATAARNELESAARKTLGAEAKFDGKTDREIREMAILKSDPAVKLDGKSEDYVAARFDAIVPAVSASGSANAALVASTQTASQIASQSAVISVPRHQQKLAFTK